MTDAREPTRRRPNTCSACWKGKPRWKPSAGSPPTPASPARSSAGARALPNSTTRRNRSTPARALVEPDRSNVCRTRRRARLTPSAWSRLWNESRVLRTAAIGASLAVLMLAVGLGRCDPPGAAAAGDGRGAGRRRPHRRGGARVRRRPRGAAAAHLDQRAVRAARLQVWTLPSRERGPVSVGLMDRARTLELDAEGSAAAGTQSAVRDHARAGRRLADRTADRTDPVQGQYRADVVG